MDGTIVNFRRGRHTQTPNQLIIQVADVDSKEQASKLVGKEVSFEVKGKQKKVLKGKITAPHGNKGVVRALMETGIPGQALGKKVNIR